MTDTKSRILDAAERLILAYGPEKATIRQITKEAGVNLAAVNYHFDSKESLANELLLRFIRPIEEKRLQMLEEAERLAGDEPPSVDIVIRCFFLPLVEFADENKNRHKMMGIDRLFDDENQLRIQFQKITQNSFQFGRSP